MRGILKFFAVDKGGNDCNRESASDPEGKVTVIYPSLLRLPSTGSTTARDLASALGEPRFLSWNGGMLGLIVHKVDMPTSSASCRWEAVSILGHSLPPIRRPTRVLPRIGNGFTRKHIAGAG